MMIMTVIIVLLYIAILLSLLYIYDIIIAMLYYVAVLYARLWPGASGAVWCGCLDLQILCVV